MNQIVNNIQLAWKLPCILRINRCKFNNKLFGDITLLKIILILILIQLI